MNERLAVAEEQDMLALGARLAGELSAGQVITLSGDLGVGKTTLVRGILRGLGFEGRVKSPSYGLVESYEFEDFTAHHLDLYRLAHPEELDFLGLEDLTGPDTVLLVEWPERGRGRLPKADLEIHISDSPGGRDVEVRPRGGVSL